MSFGYVFFIINDSGSFKQVVVRDKEDLDPDELNDGDKVIAKIPLTEKSLLAFEALDAFENIERISGSQASMTSFSELMYWLVEKSSTVSFTLGRKIEQEEQSKLQKEQSNLEEEKTKIREEIDRLTSEKF
jgi:hypothetical protein